MRHVLSIVALVAGASGCATAKCPQAAESPGSSPPAAPGEVEVVDAAGAHAVITLDADGRTWIDGQPVASDDEIAQKLGTRASATSVTLAADARLPHGRVVAVIDRLRAAGVTRIAYAPQTGVRGAPKAATAAAPESPASPANEPAAPENTQSAPTAPAEPAAALPEVIVETVGLHIGGGPNDDASKAPFLRALGDNFDAFRACYVKAEEPEKGGTFGVDLFIGRAGGAPQVRQPRTGMKGNEFRTCVVEAFGQVAFEKPQKGPTVISYSIRYRLK